MNQIEETKRRLAQVQRMIADLPEGSMARFYRDEERRLIARIATLTLQQERVGTD